MKFEKPICCLTWVLVLAVAIFAGTASAEAGDPSVAVSDSALLAQGQDDFNNDPDAAAGGIAVCLGACACYGLPFLILFGINAACGYIVYSDATKNGVENAVLWAAIAFFTNWVGTLIYFLVIKKQHMEKTGGQ